MSVQTTGTRQIHTANGVTTSFAFSKRFLADSHLIVTKTDALGVTTTYALTTDYTVTGAGDPTGGAVVFVTAPASGLIITIQRVVPLTQLSNYVNDDDLPEEVMEKDFDLAVMRSQQQQDASERSLKYPSTEPLSTSAILPDKTTRSGKVLGFDEDGEPIANQAIAAWRSNWVTGTAYNFGDIFRDGGNGNLYVVVASPSYVADASIPADVTAGNIELVLNVEEVSDFAAAAEAAKEEAETAQAGAEAAQAASESARDAAQAAKGLAEDARDDAQGFAISASDSAAAASTSEANAYDSALAAAASAALVKPYSENQYSTASGTNSYAVTLEPPVSSYVIGGHYQAKIANANTGASTIDFGGGATEIKYKGSALSGGELAANMIAEFIYDGTNMDLLNPHALPISGGTMTGAITLPADPSSNLQAATKQYVDNKVAGSPSVQDFRLTLESGVPVSTSDQTAKTALYLTPHTGKFIALYYSSAWQMVSSSEVSIAVPATTNTNYDVFAYYTGSAVALELTAWTNDTTRATSLTRQDGVLVKSSDVTRRYIGTFRTTGTSGQTEDSLTKRLVYNAYNQVQRVLQVVQVGMPHTYTTATWREWNNTSANRLQFVLGEGRQLTVFYRHVFTGSGGGSASFTMDATNGPGWSGLQLQSAQADSASDANAVSAGYHYATFVEYGNGSSMTYDRFQMMMPLMQ